MSKNPKNPRTTLRCVRDISRKHFRNLSKHCTTWIEKSGTKGESEGKVRKNRETLGHGHQGRQIRIPLGLLTGLGWEAYF